MYKKNDTNLELFKSSLRKKLGNNLIKIILFGSRARGEADKYSDYDCIIVLRKSGAVVKDKIIEIEGDLLYKRNVVFSAFPFSEKELLNKEYEPFLINAKKEGIEL